MYTQDGDGQIMVNLVKEVLAPTTDTVTLVTSSTWPGLCERMTLLLLQTDH